MATSLDNTALTNDKPSSEPPQSLFFTLPPELRFSIYDYAYPDNQYFSLTSTKFARLRAGQHQTRRKRAKCPLRKMVVCRQWYEEAVGEWFREKIISPVSVPDWVDLCNETPSNAMWKQKLRSLYLGARWTSRTWSRGWDSEIFTPLTLLPLLHSLIVRIDGALVRKCYFPHQDEWKHTLNGVNFAAIPGIRDFLQSVSQVETLRITPAMRKSWRYFGEERWKHLGQNVRALEKWMNSEVKVLRQKETKAKEEIVGKIEE